MYIMYNYRPVNDTGAKRGGNKYSNAVDRKQS